ncbi:unnamed protein product [Nezara viridula]|uniref:Survival of motor neuron-related-splicing factor 30 n=1 Tax=Nezara viridula TaxID=85310 RepID=A0A9P0E642_NEZVI|nr:unnamed protein product [Nezara viridula]
MDITEQLSEEGWKLSPEGYNVITEDGKITDLAVIKKKALDIDLRELGGCAFPPEMNKGKYESVTGNMVVQIQKIRNISEPKANEESKHAPRMFKLILTDGTQSCSALEMSPLVDINFNTPPGTKLKLKGEMVISHGLLLLHTENVEVLGGRVIVLVEKWLTNKNLAKQARGRVGAEGGPPPWIPFGEKLAPSNIADKNFKSLDDGSKDGRDNEEFEAQRRDAIAEAGKAAGCTKKVFGGGTKPLLDRNIQAIMSQGFTIQEAEAALKQSKNNIDRALRNLQRKSGKGPDDKEKTEKEPGRERGRRKGNDEESGPKPSGRVSLFSFLEDKLPSLPEKDKSKEKEWEAPKQNYETNNKSKSYPGQEKNRNRGDRGPQNNFIIGNGIDKKKDERQSRWQNQTQNQKPPRFQNQNRRSESNNDPFDHFANRNDQQPGRQNDNYFGSKASPPQYNGYRNNYKMDSIGYNLNSGGDYRSQNSNYFKPAGMPDIPEFPYKDSAFIPPLLPPSSNQFMNSSKNNVNHNTTQKPESAGKYRWKVGDKCMAKYWEDNVYYNAEVTGISKKTCVVRFLEYGNFEEVLQDDCLPITEEPLENINLQNNDHQGFNNSNRNNHFSGSIEFRRGGTRPYIKPESAAGRKQRYSQPVYVPPASRREAK